ncbi:MAG: pyridoxamine 5'-phosphate oxidase family protein, partial [Candidatus Methanoperedens sp.]|nr:pyridoxamine 5'-phosphate oxidase family protein [Candidatus Methanoperedens sp.]
DSHDQPHLTPVFFIYDENSQKLFFITNDKSKKVKNLSENPNVSITIDIRDSVNPFNNEGVMAQGTATITDKAP